MKILEEINHIVSQWKKMRYIAKTPQGMVMAGVLTALNIVLHFLTFTPSPYLEIGFSFLPLLIAGYLGGSVVAMEVGFAGDILGYLVRPNGFFFLGFTWNAVFSGAVYGMILFEREISWRRTLICLAITSVFVNLVFTPLWLHIMYHTDVYTYIRIIKTIIKFPVDVILSYMMLRILHEHSILRNIGHILKE